MQIYIETLREKETKLINRRFFSRNYKLQELMGWCTSVPKTNKSVNKEAISSNVLLQNKENKELLNNIHQKNLWSLN